MGRSYFLFKNKINRQIVPFAHRHINVIKSDHINVNSSRKRINNNLKISKQTNGIITNSYGQTLYYN